MAILVKLNQVCLHNATLSPILVNLDKVCYIKAYTVPDQDHNVSEGAKLFSITTNLLLEIIQTKYLLSKVKEKFI